MLTEISVLVQRIHSQAILDCAFAICAIISTLPFLISPPFHLRSLVHPQWKGCETQLTGLGNDFRKRKAQEDWRPGQRDLLKGLLSTCYLLD